jgi:hypothetical protein
MILSLMLLIIGVTIDVHIIYWIIWALYNTFAFVKFLFKSDSFISGFKNYMKKKKYE